MSKTWPWKGQADAVRGADSFYRFRRREGDYGDAKTAFSCQAEAANRFLLLINPTLFQWEALFPGGSRAWDNYSLTHTASVKLIQCRLKVRPLFYVKLGFY